MDTREQILEFIGDSGEFAFPKARVLKPSMKHYFNRLALQLAHQQYEEIPAYRKWVDFKGENPLHWGHWENILPFPVRLFKTTSVGVPGTLPEAVWLSSGTTSSDKSQTPLVDTRFYDLAIKRESEDWFRDSEDFLHVGLMPYSWDWPNSSLAYMFEKIFPSCIRPITLTESGFELDVERVAHALNHAIENSWPVRFFGTSYAFIKLFEAFEPIELPEGSELIDTGGYKGIVADRTREEFIALATSALGPHLTLINEYGMSELSSQFWSRTTFNPVGRGISDEEWEAPYWVRARVLNPVTYRDDPDGVLVVYDLANVWVPFVLQTEDLARVQGQSLWPLGRAKGAVAKGCSLTAEQALSSQDLGGLQTVSEAP